jgi:hypothetical protein
MDFRNPFGSPSGTLSKIWDDAKTSYTADNDKEKKKAKEKILDKINFGEGLSPGLNDLEQAVGDFTKLRTKTIPELRAKVMRAVVSYRGKTELEGLKELTAALDTIRDKVESLVAEVEKAAAATKTG